MPKVSVIVPVCNVERYVAECLETLIHQTLKDIEIICLNDGSTDNSGKILEDYRERDKRVKVVHKENTGYGNSMNIGLQMACGDYIAIVESDDFVEPNMLEILYNTAVEQEADIVKGEYFRYQNGSDTYAGRMRDFSKGKMLTVQDTPMLLILADTIWSALYRRRFLVENEIAFHETPGASFQDISFAIQGWIHASRVWLLETPLVHYRIDNLSSSMHNPNKIFCVFDEYEWAEKRLKDKWKEIPETEKYFVATKYRDYFNHYCRVGAQYQYALLMRLKESFEKDMKDRKVCESAFLPEVWKNLAAVQEDVNTFFQQTAKNTSDMRLELCEFENEKIYADLFLDRMKECSRVVIYGAGKVGQRLAKVMIQSGCVIDCFAVTEIEENERECMGIPVRGLQELIQWADSCTIIIAVVERNQYELYNNLVKYNFKHVIRVDTVIKKILTQADI